jgi:putative ABC transport system permease protein
VRAALGAEGRALSLLVLRQGARIAAAGIILGLAGGLALSRIFAAVLYGVGARDPVSFCAAAAVLSLVAFAACLLPARAAAKADPIVALRAE